MSETTISTLEVQNYHFAPKGNMLDLIFKIITRSYLHEFYEYAIYTTI